VQWLRRALGAPQTEPARRLYLPRTTRRIVNERQVLNMLAPRGFEVVSPEGLSLRDQIALFASAAVAVGAHGAAFANGIFSPRLTVLECYQPAHVNVSISAVMAAAGHEHWSLTCRRIPALRRRRSHNMLVDVELLSRSLDAMNVGA
jgi:capsular polysaccharide biosynthesis protein